MNRPALVPLCAFVLFATGSCQQQPAVPLPQAFQVTDRAQLFGGGPRALGDIGDYILLNDKIRVVVQNAGFSRGFGVYGGSIIDADQRRPDEQGRGQSNRNGGSDIFAEMFPSFFFQAVACDKVEVLSDGTKPFDRNYGGMKVHYDAGVAVVRASGGGGEFLTLLKLFDSIFLNYILPTSTQTPDGMGELIRLALLLAIDFDQFQAELNKQNNVNARYEVDYVLKPGARHIQIRSRIINKTTAPLPIPSPLLKNPQFQAQLGGVDLGGLRVPIGVVMLYGRLNNVFLPGTGFDLRHPIDRAFKRALPLPAFSGLVAEFIASSSARINDRVSYGLIAAPSERNFVNLAADTYRDGGKWKEPWTPISNSSLLVPFTAISFIGVFSDSVQSTIMPGEFIEQEQDFIVGGGDVASIVDEIATIRGTKTGRYEAIMRDARSGEAVGEGQIVIYQELQTTDTDFAVPSDYLDSGLRLCATANPHNLCRPYSQDYPDDAGNMTGTLPPGRYAYRVQGGGRVLGPFVPFEIKENQRVALSPVLPRPSFIEALAVDESGRPIPAKVSVVGQYDADYTDAERRSGRVFDIGAGESYRFSDMLDDKVPGQRAYIEAVGYTDGEGHATLAVRPGDYKVYFSRGFEYDLVPVDVHVEEGNGARAVARIIRVVDTTGWMSYDGHIHSENSIDSSMSLRDRVLSVAAEGLELAMSTDHNFVSDWRPVVDELGLRPWMASFVGIEFTTLESGHFNSYPLDYKVVPVTHGAFEWYGHPPGELFDGLRKIADPVAGNVVVCNHPRDATQGYFNQYGRSSLTGESLARGQSQRLAGVTGPAFYDAAGRSTLSYNCDALEIVNGKLGHEIHWFRVPENWPKACYEPLPPGFDPKKDTDPCSLNGKILRPASQKGALVPGLILVDVADSAKPGPSGIDNVEAVFPGAVDDWFHMLNQGYRHTGIGASDSHAGPGEEPGAPRTFVNLGKDDPVAVTATEFVDAVKNKHAATMSHGPFLVFTVARGKAAPGGVPIGSELSAPDGDVTINYKLAAAPWVSVNRINVWVNGRIAQVISVDPNANLADVSPPEEGPLWGHITLKLDKDSWIVMEAVGYKPMFPVITGTEEPFLLVADAIGALGGALGIGATTDIGAVVVGNPAPYALTNPVWVKVSGADKWQPPGVVPYVEYNVPAQDPKVGVLLSRNHY